MRFDPSLGAYGIAGPDSSPLMSTPTGEPRHKIRDPLHAKPPKAWRPVCRRLARRLSGAPHDLSENDITAWMRRIARFSLVGLFGTPVIFKDVLPVIVQVNALLRAKRFRLD